MRPSLFLSIAAHFVAVGWGLLYMPVTAKFEATQAVIVPVDVIEVADMTSLIPVNDKAKIEDKPADVAEKETVVPAAAPKVEEDTVNLPDAASPPPPPKKPEEPKKAEPKPDPKKSRQQEIDDAVNAALSGITKDQPKVQRDVPNQTAQNTSKGPPRMGAGDMRRNAASITDKIRSQMIQKRCWTNHEDMADAQRLRAVIRVWFGQDGKFAREPELREPREPAGDMVLQTYIAYARTALSKCNAYGWEVPEAYFRMDPNPYPIDIEFLPGMGSK